MISPGTCMLSAICMYLKTFASTYMWGWLGGANVLGKLPVPGCPTNLDYSRARAYCACHRCGWGVLGHFFSQLSLLFSFSLSLGDGPIWTEILSQRAVKPKTTIQSAYSTYMYYKEWLCPCILNVKENQNYYHKW